MSKDLLLAASSGNLEELQAVIADDPDIDIDDKDWYGSTALHCAVRFNRLNIVKYLIENHNADAYAQDGEGKNTLHIASLCGCVEIVYYLIRDRSMDPSVTDMDGETAEDIAADGYMDSDQTRRKAAILEILSGASTISTV